MMESSEQSMGLVDSAKREVIMEIYLRNLPDTKIGLVVLDAT